MKEVFLMNSAISNSSTYIEPTLPVLPTHTFTYGYSCSHETYQQLYTQLMKGHKVHRYTNKRITSYTTMDYYSIGLNQVEFKVTYFGNELYKYGINFLINPLLLQSNDKILYNQIISISKIKDIPYNLSSLLYELSDHIIDALNEGKIHRADYCSNLWFSHNHLKKIRRMYFPIDSQLLAQLYMNLLVKGNIPPNFKSSQTSTSRQDISEPKEFTIQCNSYELSIYLKHAQILEHNERTGKNIYDEDSLNDSYGQIRFELRLSRKRLYYDKKTLHCTEFELISGSNIKVFPTLKKLLKSIYGTGDFLHYKEATYQIQKKKSGKVQQNMLHFLQIVKQCKCLTYEKLHKCDPNITKDVFKRYLNYFNEINISPITLPNKSPVSIFPNPIKYLEGQSFYCLRKTDSIIFEKE